MLSIIIFIFIIPIVAIIILPTIIFLAIKNKKNISKEKEQEFYKQSNEHIENITLKNSKSEMQTIEAPNIQENYSYQYQEEKKEQEKIFPYERTLLLTKREWEFYKRLKKITDKYNLHILSKVRMEDIIKVKDGLTYSETQSARGRIKSRHIDFIIAEPEYLKVLLAIELDDNSHKYKKSVESDKFKNDVFNSVGLPYIRTYGYDDIEYLICQTLNLKKI